MSRRRDSDAGTACALGATGLGIAAFAQQPQAPSMPADLAGVAERGARRYGSTGAITRTRKWQSARQVTRTAPVHGFR